MTRRRVQEMCMTLAAIIALSGCASSSCVQETQATRGEWGGAVGQPTEVRRPGTLDAVPISVSVVENNDAGARTLRVVVLWDGLVVAGRTLHLRWQVSKFANDPPFQHVSPQVVLALSSASHWKKIAEDNDEECPTGLGAKWEFHIPVKELWEVPAGFQWGAGARVDLSVFASMPKGDQGATGWNTTALAPPGAPTRPPRE